MSLRKVTIAFGTCLLLAGATVGVGLVAVAGHGPVVGAAQPLTKQDGLKAQPKDSPPQTADEAKGAQSRQQRDERIRKLEKLKESFRADLRAHEAQIRLMIESSGPGIEEVDEKIRLQRQRSDLGRELLVEDVRDASKRLRESRTELLITEETKGVNDPATIAPRAKVKVAEKQLGEAKTAFRHFEEILGEQTMKLMQERQKRVRMVLDQDALQKELEPARAALAQIETELVKLRMEAAGAPLDNTPQSGIEAKTDKLIREVEALRHDVQELKKK
jgi:hypothetical protein